MERDVPLKDRGGHLVGEDVPRVARGEPEPTSVEIPDDAEVTELSPVVELAHPLERELAGAAGVATERRPDDAGLLQSTLAGFVTDGRGLIRGRVVLHAGHDRVERVAVERGALRQRRHDPRHGGHVGAEHLGVEPRIAQRALRAVDIPGGSGRAGEVVLVALVYLGNGLERVHQFVDVDRCRHWRLPLIPLGRPRPPCR